MAPTGHHNLSTSDGNNDPPYSPITLSPHWPKIGRLIFVLIFSIFGSIMNGFFLSSFCMNKKRIGNLFLAIVGLADMLITATVMPVVVVILLSGEWENMYVCKLLQFLTQTATYAFSLNFAFVGAENYFRVCRNPQEYKTFISMGIEVIAFLSVVLSITVAGFGVYLGLDYDYCTRAHVGNYHFKLITSIFFTIVPSFMVYGFLIITMYVVRGKIRSESRYRQSRIYGRDFTMLTSNLIAYTLYILAWIPYFVIVNRYPTTSDSTYYNTAWTGVIRSVAFGFSYGVIDRNYRHIYGHLFNYCCCKIDLSNPFAGRRRNRAYVLPAVAEVRVHVLQHGILNAPQHGIPVVLETQAL